ncbi:MAG TPA: hypothetical protein PK402_07710 [Tepidisphaeraceae bacterium]|nr:hypothetical protein [Tepidisphaeraceae bacterium]
MQDPNPPQKPNRPLSEISHLFLSNLRDNGNAQRPVRIPPNAKTPPTEKPRDSVDLSADEMAQVIGKPTESNESHADFEPKRKRVSAVIATHLNGHAIERVTDYALHLSSRGERIGLIIVDTGELRLQLVDCAGQAASASEPLGLEPRRMSEALLELNHDVDRWLIMASDPRRSEARGLLHGVDDWTLLITCDHDGIVAGYRTLKGLADGPKHPLSIALLGAESASAAEKVFGKLAGVCRQFLDWDVTAEAPVEYVESGGAHEVLWCRAKGDKAAIAQGVHWQVLKEFLELTPDESANRAHYGEMAVDATSDLNIEIKPALAPVPSFEAPIADGSAELAAGRRPPTATPLTKEPPMQIPSMQPAEILSDVIDLPDGVSVLSAIMQQGHQLLGTPIQIPMCPGATVAVDRERSLVLVAQLGAGLNGLNAIAAGIKWLEESRQLVAMAMPQLAINIDLMPRVHMLIDRNDRTAEALNPLLGNARITIQTYRKLKWGGRTGLLLEAA